MFPTTVPHVDTVRLSLCSSEARKIYRDMIRHDLIAGEKNEAAAGLYVYLEALSAFDMASKLAHIGDEELKRKLFAENNLSDETMLQILTYLDLDQIPVPLVTTYTEKRPVAA